MNTGSDDINLSMDYKLPNPPSDSVSSIKFYPDQNNHVVLAGSWDNKCTVWNINCQVYPSSFGIEQNENAQINANTISQNDYKEPVLSVSWQQGEKNYFTGTCDGSIYITDLNTNTISTIGKHTSGCKEVLWDPYLKVLFTGGWDSYLYLWDIRNPGHPAMQYQLPERVISMSSKNNFLVVATQQKKLCYFNLDRVRNMSTLNPELTSNSHLKFQTRKVACFSDGRGYAIGSIEGRVAIKNVLINGPLPEINKDNGTASAKDDYAFRCHRTTNNPPEVYAVNDIAFNPKYGTFVTAGGDGCFTLWDKDNKSKLKTSKSENISITACDISESGILLAYAQGYDWSRGINGDPKIAPKIGIHYLQPKEREKKK